MDTNKRTLVKRKCIAIQTLNGGKALESVCTELDNSNGIKHGFFYPKET
jgi:hypothetical protein